MQAEPLPGQGVVCQRVPFLGAACLLVTRNAHGRAARVSSSKRTKVTSIVHKITNLLLEMTFDEPQADLHLATHMPAAFHLGTK